MPRVQKIAFVPYSPEAMFDLVNDVEAYPQFLPWCERAQIESRQAGVLVATLAIVKGPLRQSLTTQNSLQPGRRIEMQLVQGPFKRFRGIWTFDPLSPAGCRVSLDLDFEFGNRILAMTVGPAFDQLSRAMVDAFHNRAALRYGGS